MKGNKKEDNVKYTYQDWSDGKIAIGGLQYGDMNVPLVPYVNWQDIDKSSWEQIKNQQRIQFNSSVERRFSKTLAGIREMYESSSEKSIFIEQTLRDFETLFEKSCDSILHLKFLNRTFTKEEVISIQNFYLQHIKRGLRHYDFMQSSNQ